MKPSCQQSGTNKDENRIVFPCLNNNKGLHNDFQVKYIPYGHQTITKSDIRAVMDVLKTDWITQGPKVREFEEVLCKYTGARYAIVLSSGTAALHAAIFAANIRSQDEVILSPVTFLATANCIVYQGGRPVFADINTDTVNIDPQEIKNKITRRTKAIIAVHFAGLPCDMDEILRIAKKYSLLVIEDASHALGGEYSGIKIGAISDMTTFSFHPVKSITTGEGGAVLTNNKILYKRLLSFRNHGVVRDNGSKLWHYEMRYLGYNYRLTDFQCALGISQMRRLNRFIRRRQEIASRYNRLFGGMQDFIKMPFSGGGTVVHAWHLYVIRLRLSRLKFDKQIFFTSLRSKNIGVQVHYMPIHLQPFYKKNFGYKKGEFVRAEKFYERAISLPIFPGLTNKEVNRVADVVIGLIEK